MNLFLLIESACSFPPSTGSWTDSKYGTIQFSGSTMFMSQTGYGTGATSTNWTCDTASGSRYLARLTIFQSCYRIYIKKVFIAIVHIFVVFYSNRTASTVLLTSGFLGNLQVYLYICMDITMVTQYSYYYYQQTGKWLELVYYIINYNSITGKNLDVTCNSSCRWDVKKANAWLFRCKKMAIWYFCIGDFLFKSRILLYKKHGLNHFYSSRRGQYWFWTHEGQRNCHIYDVWRMYYYHSCGAIPSPCQTG